MAAATPHLVSVVPARPIRRRAALRIVGALALVLACLHPAAPARAQSQTVTVGPAPGCTSTTLPGALASLPRLGPGVVHRVRIMSGSMITGGATLERISARIEGGYASCTATTPQPGVRSRITGTAMVPLLRLRNETEADAEYRIELRDLELRDAPVGAIEVLGRVTLRLDRIELVNNVGPQGAGLRVVGRPAGWTRGALVEFGEAVVVNANQAVGGDGGGIHCSAGAALRVLATPGPFVINNLADGRGGGVYAMSCELAVAPGLEGLGLRVANNRAVGGGGVALVDGTWAVGANGVGARIEIESNTATGEGDGGGLLLQRSVLQTSGLLRMVGNRAGGSGGGAWIDAGQVEQRAAVWELSANEAVIGGGALHLQGDALLATVDSASCAGPCVRIEGNAVTGTGINRGAGGAMMVLDRSTVAWDRVRLRGNRAAMAAILFANGAAPSGSLVEWSNVAAFGNSGAYGFGFEGAPVVLGGGAALRLRLATFAGNEARAAGAAIPQGFRLFDGASIALRGVVVDQPGWVTLGRAIGAAVAVGGSCVLSRETASLAAFGVSALAADPRLDASADAVRLRVDSPAIDACSADALADADAALGVVPLLHDIEGRRRPVRFRSPPGGPDYDAGAEEYDDRLFRAGFESGTD
jgi:hypothetical protein